MSVATIVNLSSSFSSLNLSLPPSPPSTTHYDQPPPTTAPTLLQPSPPSSASSATTNVTASFPVNPLNEYQSSNPRHILTLAVTPTHTLSTSARVAASATSSLPRSSPSFSPHPSSSSSSFSAGRLSRRRQRTDEEQPPTATKHTSTTTTTATSSSEPIDHITAHLSLLSTLDTQQPAKRIHTDTNQPPPSPPPPFLHPIKPKPAKRRTARTAALVTSVAAVDSQRCAAVAAAARLAVDELLYDSDGGESEAEWESEHGSELRFLLDSMHVADKDVQAGCMPYIL